VCKVILQLKCFLKREKNIQDYQQARQASAIVRHATDILPNLVVRIKDSGALESFLGEMADIPHLLLFTTKSEVAPLLKSLSVVYKGRVAFGQVKQEVTEVVQKYSVDSFPKIILLQGDAEPIVYDGAINPDELKQFVSSHASETVSSAPPPPPPQRRAAPKAGKDVSYIEFTVDNFESECTGYCIVGFVDTETTDTGRVVKAEQQKVLDYVLNNFKSDGKFKFGWVDKQSQDTLVSKFSVDSNTPTLLVYHAKRSKYVKSESFAEKDIFRTVEHVLTGHAHYTSL
jgi:thioredoxin-related protein